MVEPLLRRALSERKPCWLLTANNKHIVLFSDGRPTYSYQIPTKSVRQAGYVLDDEGDYVTGINYSTSAYGETRLDLAVACLDSLKIMKAREHTTITVTLLLPKPVLLKVLDIGYGR